MPRFCVAFAVITMMCCVRGEAPAQSVDRPLFVMNVDGSGLRKLVDLGERNSHGSPDWSPDGQHIAFDAWPGADFQDGRIFVVDVDGNNSTDLGPGGGPEWSPDGKQIAYHAYAPEDGIWVMDPDGSGREQLTPRGRGPRWSPDGKRLAFVETTRLVVFDLASGKNVDVLGRRYGHTNAGFQWSPDGAEMSFVARDRNGQLTLAVVDARGIDVGHRVLARPNAFCHAAWSPGGKKILFWQKHDGKMRLFIVDANGDGQPELVPGQEGDKDHGDAAWSPDGKRIVFARGNGF